MLYMKGWMWQLVECQHINLEVTGLELALVIFNFFTQKCGLFWQWIYVFVCIILEFCFGDKWKVFSIDSEYICID